MSGPALLAIAWAFTGPALPAGPPHGAAAQELVLENARLRVVATWDGSAWQEAYAARRGKAWVHVLTAGSAARQEPALRVNAAAGDVRFVSAERRPGQDGRAVLRLSTPVHEGAIIKEIALDERTPSAHVTVSYRTGRALILQHLLSTYTFVPEGRVGAASRPPDFVFTPQLRPEPDQVIGDHVFRSPALMLQQGPVFAALVPDLESIDGRGRAIRTTADLQAEAAGGPFFSFGLQNWAVEPYRKRNTHVFYTTGDSLGAPLGDTTVSMAYRLFLSATAARQRGFMMVTEQLWERYGRPALQQPGGPQSAPFASDIHKAWRQYLPAIALDTVYEKRPVTLLRQARLAWSNQMPAAADTDCWFNVWFNALRTAYGVALYADARHDAQLARRAEQVLNLALLAPQKEGIAPSIFYLDSTGGHWVADHAWGGIAGGKDYAMFHNAWTCSWLLEWASLRPGRRAEILAYVRRFGDFLCAHQRPTGVIPSWYDPVTLEPAPELRDDNAETAGAALLLTKLSDATGERRYRDAAERAMGYIIRDVMPARRWYDFETFFSCSRKALGFFDRVTGQHPQNTLSMHQAAEACRLLFLATGRTLYRDRGEEILRYLCLYQQVWSPAWLSRPLFGGFGVQNTDAEWSDARQGYFAVTLVDYYALTGRREYFERGIAALRAMFSLYESPASPRTAENYAHSGHDEPAGVTGIHWGTGSSVVSVHLITQRYGDALVDVAGAWGCGIDGCRVDSVAVRGSTIAFRVMDNVATPRELRITFTHPGRAAYTIVANGRTLGTFSRSHLKKGVPVALP